MSEEYPAQDKAHMAHALELAAEGLYTTDPNPRVGCVIAQGERVFGSGWHMRAGEAHAEVIALRAAGPLARGATAYVTLEPCSHTGRTPPCADALIEAGIVRVVCCSEDPNPLVAGAGIRRLRAAGVEVSVGVLAAEARRLNGGFFSRFERHRPWVRLKMAMSLDARTAAARRAQGALLAAAREAGALRAWISSSASRNDVQQWRARSSAVLTGSGTVKSDDPGLDVRWAYGPWVRQPLRIVLDTMLSCPANAKVFKNADALVFAAPDAPARAGSTVRVERVARAAGGLSLGEVLGKLAQLQMNEVLLECGARLAGSFIAEDLVDEIILYMAPSLLGENAAPLLYLGGADPLDGAGRYEFCDIQRIADDVRLTLVRRH